MRGEHLTGGLKPGLLAGRRQVIAGAMAAILSEKSVRPAIAQDVAGHAGDSRPRVIALDWAVAETLVALGHPPVGAAEIPNYDRTVVEPRMPSSVMDVGLRLAPNPELMWALAPQLTLINPQQNYMRPALAPFGRVETVPIYVAAGQPYRLAVEATEHLGATLGDRDSAGGLIAACEQAIAETRARLEGYDGRPVYLVGFLDGRHAYVAGKASLYQSLFDRVGLRNAWRGASDDWGVAPIGVEALAAEPEARLLYRTPLPEGAKRMMVSSPLWLRLPFVRKHRVHALPPVWSFGALPSAMRIARLLGDALTAPEEASG